MKKPVGRADYSHLFYGDGQTFDRVSDWVDPDEAAALVAGGMPYYVEWCRRGPVKGLPERFKADVLRSMITRSDASRYDRRRSVPTVMVGELWRSAVHGDCLLFLEQGPEPR